MKIGYKFSFFRGQRVGATSVARKREAKASPTLFLLVFLFLCFYAVAYGDNIAVTRHNLSVTGPGPIKALSENQICIFCHTPHNADPAVPLWNRRLSSATYTPYTSQLLNAAAGQPTGSSKLCLSCHDGTIALGEVGSRPEAIQLQEIGPGAPVTTLPTTSPAYIGTDLRDDHPVSFVFNQALILADKGGELALPPAGDPVRLDREGQVQCTSCHNPHDDTYTKFLVKDNGAVDPQSTSGLCTTCHRKAGWEESRHNPLSPYYFNHPVYQGTNGAPVGTPLKEWVKDGCLNCHDPHGDNPADPNVYLLKRPLAIPRSNPTRFDPGDFALCIGCHDVEWLVRAPEQEFHFQDYFCRDEMDHLGRWLGPWGSNFRSSGKYARWTRSSPFLSYQYGGYRSEAVTANTLSDYQVDFWWNRNYCKDLFRGMVLMPNTARPEYRYLVERIEDGDGDGRYERLVIQKRENRASRGVPLDTVAAPGDEYALYKQENAHWFHLFLAGGGGVNAPWDSDQDGTADSGVNCPTCHNPHGSRFVRLTQDGRRIESEPGLAIAHLQETIPGSGLISPDGDGLEYSVGGISQNLGFLSVPPSGVCAACHRGEPLNGTPFSISDTFAVPGMNTVYFRGDPSSPDDPDDPLIRDLPLRPLSERP